mgnify:CR=1 FL=1
MEKEELRKAMRRQKAALSDAEKLAQAAAVWRKVETLTEFQRAQNILLYHSLADELTNHDFLEKWCGKKNIFLPKVDGDDLLIIKYTGTNLVPGAFNILEPCGESVSPDIIDVIVVPGVAFDRMGNRMGRGRGFYDRLLAATHATKIGVAFSCQIVESVPTDAHDIAMDFVVTDDFHSDSDPDPDPDPD